MNNLFSSLVASLVGQNNLDMAFIVVIICCLHYPAAIQESLRNLEFSQI